MTGERLEHSIVVHPGALDEPEAIASLVLMARRSATGYADPAPDVNWDEPLTGLVTVPRHLLDPDTPDDSTPVRMAQVTVRGTVS